MKTELVSLVVVVSSVIAGCGKGAGGSGSSSSGASGSSASGSNGSGADSASGSASGTGTATIAPASTAITNLPLDAAVAARLPASRSLAFTTDDATVIARLDRTGLHELARGPRADQLAWSGDGTALVALAGGTSPHRDITLWTYAGTAAPTTITIANTGGPDDDSPLPGAVIAAAASGEVWVRRCMDTEQLVVKHGIVGCKDWRYRRIAPAGGDEGPVAPAGFAAEPPLAPRVEAPTGYLIKPVAFTLPTDQVPDGVLHHNGWDCTGPAGSSRYPDDSWSNFDEYRGRKVRWIQRDPPLYEATAQSTSLIGEKNEIDDVFLACRSTPLDAYVDLGAGVWAEYKQVIHDHEKPDGAYAIDHIDHTWTLRVGSVDVATLDAVDLVPAPPTP